jgi:lipoteichoic acid synthase
MAEESKNKKDSLNRLAGYIEAIFLPIILAAFFAFQNQIFNVWLGLYSKTYSLRLTLVAFALGIILYGPALLFKKRYRYIYLFLVSFLVSLLFSSQFIYYRYSQSFLQFSAIKYIGQTEGVLGTIKVLLTPELLLFVANITIVLGAFLLTLRKNYVDFVSPRSEKIFIIFLMVAMVIFGYKYLLDTEKKEWGSTSRLYTDVYDLKSLVGKMGIVNFFIEDTFKYALRSNLVSQADQNFLQSWAKDRPAVKNSQNYFGIDKGKNLIIIQVESLENSVINKTIAGQEITPNLNQLTKDGLYFDNYYTQIGPGNTADAEFSTMDSLYPLPDDVVFIDYAKNQYHALPQLLVNSGYKTYSMHGDAPTFWNRSNIYPGLGYQKAYDLDDYIVTTPVGKGPSDLGDEDLFSQSLPRLESFKQPFMATLITMSLHTPFILPADLQTLNIPANTNLDQTQWEYLEAAHYTDKAIGEFIDGLKKDGLYDNSLIFIWGDHGSFTNISSALAQKNLQSQNPQTAQLYKNLDVGSIGNGGQDENTLPEIINSQVPMLILAPGLNLSGPTNIPGSHLDIYPTVANLLGIQPPTTILGQDLLNTKGSAGGYPVETHFELVSDGIDAILTSNLAYEAGDDGLFKDGACESWPDQKPLPISQCSDLYNKQAETLKASNIIIRGNLLNDLLDKKK